MAIRELRGSLGEGVGASRGFVRDTRLLAGLLATLLVSAPALAFEGDIVASQVKPSVTSLVVSGGRLGSSFARLNDVSGAGAAIVVGAFLDGSGAFHVLFLDAVGEIQSSTRVDEANDPNGVFEVAPAARFGRALAALGDLDGDGNIELAVGAPATFAGTPGSVWILDLDPATGVPVSGIEIGDAVGGLSSSLIASTLR